MPTKWTIKFEAEAIKELSKLDKSIRIRVIKYLEEHLSKSDDPRIFGKPLTGSFAKFWRYRVGNYRVICSIEDRTLVILVVRVAHRKNVYH